VFSVVELKTASLDYGITGVSQAHMLCLFAMAFAIPMIPYLLLYLSLSDEKGQTRSLKAAPAASSIFGKMFGWVHPHSHPVPHH
jgi:hypothetical protein